MKGKIYLPMPRAFVRARNSKLLRKAEVASDHA